MPRLMSVAALVRDWPNLTPEARADLIRRSPRLYHAMRRIVARDRRRR